MADGLLFLFGGIGYTAPVVLFAVGALLVVRPVLPLDAPAQGAGASASGPRSRSASPPGSLGLGPGDTPRDGFLDADYLEHHGGLVGESLFWVERQALLGGRVAHPVRLPAAGGRAAADRRVGRGGRERDATRRP